MEEYKDILVELSIYSTFCKHTGDLEGSALTSKAYDVIRKLSYKYEKALSDLVKGSKSNWVPVTERLPEENGFYLCLYESKAKGGVAMDEGLSILQFINKKWSLFDSFVVTHWLPIPEPPKEE